METMTNTANATSTTGEVKIVQNYINGQWVDSKATEFIEVTNSATGQIIAKTPCSSIEEVSAAIENANAAFPAWKATPAVERVKYLFKIKELMEAHFEEIVQICTKEHGKTLIESRGDVRRGIDHLDCAIGIPTLLMGESSEDISRGIDCRSIRRPLGVYTAITPFNFPPMVPLWFFPYAIASGNTFVLKPSEQVPLSQVRIFELIQESGLPPGVMNMVQGTKDVVNTFCSHPMVKGVSFVGSTAIAKHVYTLGCAHGKRVQALGGAKNFLVAMPDTNTDFASKIMCDSSFGCAGERCLAGSVILAHKDIYEDLKARIVEKAKSFKLGNGADPATGMGPVISESHKKRVLSYIEKGIAEGANLLLDGRNPNLDSSLEGGHFLGISIFDQVTPDMTIAKEEIFGPVMCIIKIDDLYEAIDIINQNPYANTSSIFTDSGSLSREFTHSIEIGMIGINLGVPAPMAYYGFGGAKDSFYGDTKAQGKHAINFYTDCKTVITRWEQTIPKKSEQ